MRRRIRGVACCAWCNNRRRGPLPAARSAGQGPMARAKTCLQQPHCLAAPAAAAVLQQIWQHERCRLTSPWSQRLRPCEGSCEAQRAACPLWHHRAVPEHNSKKKRRRRRGKKRRRKGGGEEENREEEEEEGRRGREENSKGGEEENKTKQNKKKTKEEEEEEGERVRMHSCSRVN